MFCFLTGNVLCINYGKNCARKTCVFSCVLTLRTLFVYVYFNGRRSLKPLLIACFLMTVKIAEYAWAHRDHTVNNQSINQSINHFFVNVYKRFLNFCHVFYVFSVFEILTSTFFTCMKTANAFRYTYSCVQVGRKEMAASSSTKFSCLCHLCVIYLAERMQQNTAQL